LRAALAAVTAAVVGVIANLSLWFALHVLFGTVKPLQIGAIRLDTPQWDSIDIVAAAIAAIGLLALLRFRLGMGWILGGAALLGLAARGL
jgi:chromate transporter